MTGIFVLIVFFVKLMSLPGDCANYRRMIKPNTQENIDRLTAISEDELAEELSGQYQGDILMTEEQMELYRSKKIATRNGLINKRFRWEGAKVPFKIAKQFYDGMQLQLIADAMKMIEDISCVRFVPFDPAIHRDYILISGNERGCFSNLGRLGGEQIVNFFPHPPNVGCFRVISMVHEMFHALGFVHMQSSSNRDRYVRIVWNKIKPEMIGNFEKYGSNVVTSMDNDYDYDSMMHYSRSAFSIDRSPTIITLRDPNAQIGQRDHLSEKDIDKLNKIYCKPTMHDEWVYDEVEDERLATE